jgi:hypothetical protein
MSFASIYFPDEIDSSMKYVDHFSMGFVGGEAGFSTSELAVRLRVPTVEMTTWWWQEENK